MNDEIESELKAALRPLAPREQFSVQLLAQVTRGGPTPIKPHGLSRARRPRGQSSNRVWTSSRVKKTILGNE